MRKAGQPAREMISAANLIPSICMSLPQNPERSLITLTAPCCVPGALVAAVSRVGVHYREPKGVPACHNLGRRSPPVPKMACRSSQ